MSGRSCSDARTVLFTGEAQLLHGPPDRGQTGGRAQGDLQFGQGAVRLRVDQRRERVQLGGEHRMPPVALLARGDFAGLAPPLFEPPDPGGTDVVCDRDGGRFLQRSGRPGHLLLERSYSVKTLALVGASTQSNRRNTVIGSMTRSYWGGRYGPRSRSAIYQIRSGPPRHRRGRDAAPGCRRPCPILSTIRRSKPSGTAER